MVLVLCVVVIAACSSSDDGDGNGNGGTGNSADDALCIDYHEFLCGKCWTCFGTDSPQACQLVYAGSSAGGTGCTAAAQAVCEEEDFGGDGDDDCEPSREPTTAEVNACMSQVETSTCDQLLDIGEPGTFPACETIEELYDCPDDIPDMGGNPDMGGGTDIPAATDLGEPPDVNTEGCEAAFARTCEILEECADTIEPGVVVQSTVDACAPAVTEGAEQVTATCEEYLQAGVATGAPTAVFLNGASAQEVDDCMTGSNCDESFLRQTGSSLISSIGTGSTDQLASILESLTEECLD